MMMASSRQEDESRDYKNYPDKKVQKFLESKKE
jgi:hypothetical protein